MEKTRLKNYRKDAYICHLILAIGVCVVLAMRIHLIMIDASGEVVGAAIFLLVMWLGLPILVLLGVVTFYTYKARADWKVVLLTSVLIVLILQWFLEIGPAMIVSIMVESLYIVLAIVIGLRPFFGIKNGNLSFISRLLLHIW